MMKIAAILALLSVAAFGQNKNSSFVVLPPQTGVATGTFDFREAYIYGQDYVGWQAPLNIANPFRITLPSAKPTSNANKCANFTTAGVMSFAKCESAAVATDYNWVQSIGNVASGVQTLTLSPCPLNASDTTWKFRVLDGTNSEIVTPTGVGSCTAGATSGTVQVTLTNSYTAATAHSDTSGIREAVYSVPNGSPVTVRLPDQFYSVYSEIQFGTRLVSLACDSRAATIIPQTAGMTIFNVSSPSAADFYNCTMTNAQALSNVTAILFNNPTGDTYGGVVDNVTFNSFYIGIKSLTQYSIDYTRNRFIDSSYAAIWTSNINNGDAGGGRIEDNKIVCTGVCNYGILHNGPGATQILDNAFNGASEQVHIEFVMGRASTATSGSDTVITWVSGNKFRSSALGRSFVIGGVSCIVDVYTNDTSMRCNGETLGTITNVQYYISATGQVQVSRNFFDFSGTTQYGLRVDGPIYFSSAEFVGNTFINYVVSSARAIEITATGLLKTLISENTGDTAPSLPGTTGITISGGNGFNVTNNYMNGWQTGYEFLSPATDISSSGNKCANNTTACVTSTSTPKLKEYGPVTQAQLASLLVSTGSSVYCSDCRQTSAGCASGGTGATASFFNFTWRCDDGGVLQTTTTNCASSVSPSVCAAAPTGSIAVAAGATTLSVNTTAVTANSLIILTFDASLGSKLGVTCNSTYTNAWVTSRTPGTSFQITVAAAPVTNRACFNYSIIN